MKPSWQRFAPVGLYIALIAAVSALGLFIVLKEFNLYVQIALALVVLGLALYAFLNPSRVRQALTGRQARYGSNIIILMIAFLGILAVINFVVNKNSKRWDLTEDKQYTLAAETVALLEKLPEDVTALAFFQSNASIADTQALLESFKYSSGGKLNYQFINPDENPVAANNAKITRYSSVVFQAGGRQELADSNTEENFASALIRLMNPGERAVYFLTGHGEYDPSGNSSDRPYSKVNSTLESKSYTVKTINLLLSPQIPADALALVIAGPLSPLSQSEVDLINSYLDGGGSLVALMEPPVVTNDPEAIDPLADYLQTTWGITFKNDIILDMSANSYTLAVGNPQDYASHAITSDIKSGNMVTLFPTARSVVAAENSTTNPVTLVQTGSQSWAETDITALQNNEANPDSQTDLVGPVSMAVAMTNSSTGARLVVIGDADFATDGYFEAYGNGDLFTNTIDWAAEQENLISLTPKATTERIMLPPKTYTMGLVLFGSIFILPGIFLVAGILNTIQHRRRG